MNSQAPNPPKPWQSKLAPYAKEIAAWRREVPPRPYAAISVLLEEKHGLRVHPDTIHSFVKVRSKSPSKRLLRISSKFLVENKASTPSLALMPENKRGMRGENNASLPPAPNSYPVVNPNQL